MLKLFKNADVYAPEHIGRKDVLAAAGRITLISEPGLELNLPELTVVDLDGRKIIPGLIDQHVHITGGGGESGFKSRAPEATPESIISAGVTTVIGLLGTDGLSRSVENLVAKTKALREEGISAWCLTGSYAMPTVTLTGSVERDVAFIEEIIGVKVAISDHRSSEPTKEELLRLATQVRVAGLLSGKVGEVHMHLGNGKKGLSDIIAIIEESDIPIKHFRPSHIVKQLSDGIDFANMGGYIDFTCADAEATAKIMVETADRAPWERMTMSSDANGSMPMWNEKKELIGITIATEKTLLDTVRALVNTQGMMLEEAILPVTKTVATALEIFGRKGCIAKGADADFVILNDDLTLNGVIAKGKTMAEDGLVIEKGYLTIR